MEPLPPLSPHAAALRQRAARLAALAAAIERTTVCALPQHAADASWTGASGDLAVAMLEHNLQQLHRTADDLRLRAHHFRVRADELDAARRAAA